MDQRTHLVAVEKENKEKIEAIKALFFQINQKITLIKQFEKEYMPDLRHNFILPKTQVRPVAANR